METPHAPVTIVAENALAHAREIKGLFLAHGRPEFPDYFDRTYPAAVARGATTWLGRDSDGRLVMHVACLPRPFTFHGRRAMGGLVANLMVAKSHRTFVPAVTLMRRLVQDTMALGTIDFLYADPNARARTLARRTGFARVGTLQRYVLPVGDPRPALDLGVRLVHAVVRAVGGGGRARVVPRVAASFDTEEFAAPVDDVRALTPHHDRALYGARLPGYPGDRDWWFVCDRNGTINRLDAALLVRGPDEAGQATLHAVRSRSAAGPILAPCVPGLITELRRRGCTRLHVMTVAESRLGHALRRCGFIPRRDAVPLFVRALTLLGEECTRSAAAWEITDVDCDR